MLTNRYDRWKTVSKHKQAGCDGGAQKLMSSFVTSAHYHKNHHRQKELTKSLVNDLIIRGNMPIDIVQQDYFRDFFKVVDSKYKLPGRYKVGSTISERFQQQVAVLKSKLSEAQFVSITLDLWSDRRMRSFMGMTVHFMTPASMEFESYLLDFSYFTGKHTGDNIGAHCSSVFDKFNISTKIRFIITDNAANMLKAFRDIYDILGIEPDSNDFLDTASTVVDDAENSDTVGDDENDNIMDTETEIEQQSEPDTNGNQEVPEDLLTNAVECDIGVTDLVNECISSIERKRLPCGIHTLQLVVLDGLKSAKFMNSIQSKASRLATLLHCSGPFQAKFSSVFKTTIPATNNTRWNSLYTQLHAVSKLDSGNLLKVLQETTNEQCIFTKREMDMLKEVVSVLEPAYDATLLMEEEAGLISLVAPTIGVLHKKWSDMSSVVKFASGLIEGLLAALERRFLGLLVNIGVLPAPAPDPVTKKVDIATLPFGDACYLVATALDPEFRLNWIDDEHDNVKLFITGNVNKIESF